MSASRVFTQAPAPKKKEQIIGVCLLLRRRRGDRCAASAGTRGPRTQEACGYQSEGGGAGGRSLLLQILLAVQTLPPTPEPQCTSLCIRTRSDRSYLDSVWAGAAGAAGAA